MLCGALAWGGTVNPTKEAEERTALGGAVELMLVRATARWCEFLQSKGSAASALSALAEAADVDAVALSRVEHGSRDRALAVVFDREGATPDRARVDQAFSGQVLHGFSKSASPGSVWLQSLFGDGDAPQLEHLQRNRNWNEMAIVPIAQTAQSMDVLEFHVNSRKSARFNRSLNILAGTLAETWGSRREGVLSELLVAPQEPVSVEDAAQPLLSFENPARLSRAEFRVCLLFGQGLSNEHVMQELDISLTTLRTHLRNIYAKTGAKGHSDLLYKLLNYGPDAGKSVEPGPVG